jgi:5-methylcytosine-specific restriction protein A
MLRRPCQHAGCPNLVTHGYCPRHAAKGEAAQVERTRQYDTTIREEWTKRFYRSSAWWSLRRQVLEEQPICGMCHKEFGHHVDHKIPLKLSGPNSPLNTDRNNLQSLCQSCHNIKTNKERAMPRSL